MARVKYDVRGVEGRGDVLPAGVYNVKITSADVTKPEGKDQRIELVLEVQDKDHKGKKLYEYVNLESEAARWRLRELLDAVGVTANGKGEAGTLDTDKMLLNKTVGVKTHVRPATEQFDEQARVRRMFPVGENGATGKVEAEDLDDAEPEAASDEEYTWEDIEGLDRKELRQLIKDEDLDVKVVKSKDDDTLRAEVAEALEIDIPTDEPEEDDPEAEADEYTWDDIKDLDKDELKTLVRDESLDVKLTPRKLRDLDAVRAEVAEALEVEVPADEAEAEDEEEDEASDDYDEWSLDDLKEELSQRSLSTKGGIKTLITRLRKDDADEDKPF
jgi:hypothetical protein